MDRQSGLDAPLSNAADAILGADALLIGAGAGMGVDSGLPDFRGPEGFWKAYPPFRGRQFHEMSTPHWFRTDPALAWGFFGHRMNLYRNAVPHAGFAILRRWAERVPLGAFVFTSNVDGQFHKAGFAPEQVLERHGSIHFLQCSQWCGQPVWPSDDVRVDVDEATIRATSAFPLCPGCGAIARPNVLMFNDRGWDDARFEVQHAAYQKWLRRAEKRKRIVAVEMGAGLAIPTVRCECEDVAHLVIRINPREPQTPPGGIPLPLGALDALTRIDALMRGSAPQGKSSDTGEPS
jgi:NAD-dependent SIR2 family protein deacetylase